MYVRVIIMGKEYRVDRNGELWSDRFETIEECKDHILNCIEEFGDTDTYTFREMTEEEIASYG